MIQPVTEPDGKKAECSYTSGGLLERFTTVEISTLAILGPIGKLKNGADLPKKYVLYHYVTCTWRSNEKNRCEESGLYAADDGADDRVYHTEPFV